MGGRGSASGIGSGKVDRNSAEYKSSYNIEMESSGDFPAAFALDKHSTKESIAYEMRVYKEVMGKSLIAETESKITELNRAYREANAMGKSYGMTDNSIGGMKAGIKEKIQQNKKALTKMREAKSEYERQGVEDRKRAAKAKRLNGKWM